MTSELACQPQMMDHGTIGATELEARLSETGQRTGASQVKGLWGTMSHFEQNWKNENFKLHEW